MHSEGPGASSALRRFVEALGVSLDAVVALRETSDAYASPRGAKPLLATG